MPSVTTLKTQQDDLLCETPSDLSLAAQANGHSSDEFPEDAGRHPLGLKPSGNAFLADVNICNALGYFEFLPHELILTLLEELDAKALQKIGETCKAFYAFSTYDQLWRDLWMNTDPQLSISAWRGSWRATFLGLPGSAVAKIDCSNLYSDALHRPYHCSQISPSSFAHAIPPKNEIQRVTNLTENQFRDFWWGRPFILTDVVESWPLFHRWDEKYLLDQYGDVVFRAESVDWPFRLYTEYMNTTKDESPLYLFDKDFENKMSLEDGQDCEFRPPECFGKDLFTLLGEERPDHKWLIIGPARSGSTFHKDPNATSAWNAVVRGSKYWIMFPPGNLPPGVHVSEDQSEVTSPLSIAEWLLTFHEAARLMPGCIEGICRSGEMLHVPSGWWHFVVNLESSIALTQNFVPEAHLNSAVSFLRHKTNQVSGFRRDIEDPGKLFLQRLKNSLPELAANVDQNETKKRKWEEVVASNKDPVIKSTSFSFGFDEDLGSDDDS